MKNSNITDKLCLHCIFNPVCEANSLERGCHEMRTLKHTKVSNITVNTIFTFDMGLETAVWDRSFEVRVIRQHRLDFTDAMRFHIKTVERIKNITGLVVFDDAQRHEMFILKKGE